VSAVTPGLAEKSIPAVLRSACVSVVEATQDRDGADIAARGDPRGHGRALLGSPLPQALMGPNRVAVRHVFVEDASQLALTQDDDVVEARAPDAAEEALAGRVLARCPIRRPYLRDAACCDNVGEGFAKRAVVVADEVPGQLPEWRGLAPRLGDPRVGRVARHTDMDHPARPERDHEEGGHRSAEQAQVSAA